jgi:hypothetical protein
MRRFDTRLIRLERELCPLSAAEREELCPLSAAGVRLAPGNHARLPLRPSVGRLPRTVRPGRAPRDSCMNCGSRISHRPSLVCPM